jgi:hypothetical protein
MAPTPPCARCGRDAQFDFDQLWLCLDCYHVAGSTCAGVTRPPTAAPAARTGRPEGAAGSASAATAAEVGTVC